MISVNDLKTGITLEIDGEIYSVVEFLHVKPGKGAAFVRTKLKNLQTGAVSERTFRAGERLQRAHIETKKMQYLYSTGAEYTFMDTDTYEQINLQKEHLNGSEEYLKDNMTLEIQFYEGRAIGVLLPTFVELEVTYTEPGLKGDTAQGGTKPATLETGKVIQVPLFVEEGTVVRVDTRTGEYLSRV